MFYEVNLETDCTSKFFKYKGDANYYFLTTYIKTNGSINEEELNQFIDNNEIEGFGAVFTNDFEKEQ